MSKDIRSYFSIKKVQKPKVDDDDDVIPESPDVQIKNKKKESRKKRIIDDDSDEEKNFKKKKELGDASRSNKKKSKTELKEIKAVDIFGNVPIKRTEPLNKKVKKQTETGIHSDEEYEKSLLEIDGIEELVSNTKCNSESTDDSKAKAKSPELSTKNYKLDRIEELNTNTSEIKYKSENTILLKPKNESNNAYNSESNKTKKSEKLDNYKSMNKEKYPNEIDNKASTSHDAKRKDKSNAEEPKINKNKRKFAEFIETEAKHDDGLEISKKKKFDECDRSEYKVNGLGTSKDSEEYSDCNVSGFGAEDRKTNKKKHFNKSLNESVLTDEERHERRINSAALYQKYLNRSGPKHLGTKQIPEGSPNCLKDCAFLLTGVLDSFERDEIIDAINKFGGCLKNSISKKVTHVLAGEDAGPAKMAKAQELGVKIINEDEFLKLIENSQNKVKENTENIKKGKAKSSKEKKSSEDKHFENGTGNKEKSRTSLIEKNKKLDAKEEKSDKLGGNIENREKSKSPYKARYPFSHKIKKETNIDTEIINTNIDRNGIKIEDKQPDLLANSSMWVEKHKPQAVKNIIGQHGEASSVKKLINWLTKWYVNRKAKLPKPSPWAKNDDGGYYKAALLSGPPGVGKTTSVALVCKELGFDVVEFNASDTRSKTLIKEQIGELLSTTSLSAYAKGDTGKQAVSKKHVLVMDEVDGMAGNEDRGGLQELINLIKSTSVPIICMCNDRNSQKMRSLVNYCYDLRFNRPKVDQIKSAMLSICFKEGLKVPPDVLTQLIVSSNQDVRQTLNLLSMWAIDPHGGDSNHPKRDSTTLSKDVKLGPWEAIRKVFTAKDHQTMSISDKSDLFFYDYSLAPLFVQENYLQVVPHCPKHEVLQRISKAADSISLGDIVEARIRRSQTWGLLPTQAMYSSVIPGHAMSGHVSGQIQFPGWLGKNSRANKMHRLCQEIHAHTRLSTSGSKSSIFLDYCTHLRDAIVSPLIKDKSDGISQSLEILESYHLLREDLDSLVELSLWPGQRNPTILIEPKVKAAMTRTYNKTASALPYAPGTIKRSRTRDDDDITLADEEADASDAPNDSDPENDALIKKKKVKDSEKASSNTKDDPSSSKGKSSKDKKKKK